MPLYSDTPNIMKVADHLSPNRPQAISNHHTDSSFTKCEVSHITHDMSYNQKLISPSATYVSANWVCIASGNGLTPVRRQAITWTNAGLLSIEP